MTSALGADIIATAGCTTWLSLLRLWWFTLSGPTICRSPGGLPGMPLSAFFDDQVETIRGFLEDPNRVVQIVQVDPEFRTILLKMLTGLDEKDDFPHLLIGHDGRFSDPVQWFADLQNALEAELSRDAADLAAEGI